MAAPDFSAETRELLMFRSSLMYNNPGCSTLTIGPSDSTEPLALKVGEAAHICAARLDQARYESSMTDGERAAFENGIWLCPSCHTMVDKLQGVDFPTSLLRSWKSNHEALIRSLLHTHRSPLPVLRNFSEEGRIAQDVIDMLEGRGALFVDEANERQDHVTLSVFQIREALTSLQKEVTFDSTLKRVMKDISTACREYTNLTSKYPARRSYALFALRDKVGVLVKKLQQEYKCEVRGDLNRIIPI